MIDRKLWRDKRVFLTGHTGYKGAWMAMLLHRLGARVYGFSLPPDGPTLYEKANVQQLTDNAFGDIRESDTIAARLQEVRPSGVGVPRNECGNWPHKHCFG